VYAHYAAIVQSSGMGKSRTVDELAKDHFVIPLNLREATSSGGCRPGSGIHGTRPRVNSSSGYPPADHSVRDYLITAGSRDIAYDRASAFLEALLKHTTAVLCGLDNSLDYVGCAREFRVWMTNGQKMTGHNQFREDFYKKVIAQAKQLETQWVRNL
jgi:hypothetical protein